EDELVLAVSSRRPVLDGSRERPVLVPVREDVLLDLGQARGRRHPGAGPVQGVTRGGGVRLAGQGLSSVVTGPSREGDDAARPAPIRASEWRNLGTTSLAASAGSIGDTAARYGL